MMSLAVTRTTPRSTAAADEAERPPLPPSFGVRDERRRRSGWREPARRAGEQGRAERVLQRVDMAPDRRLGQAKAARGAAQAHIARDFEEGAQFVPVGLAAAHTKMYS
jgi:hypothetical protein